MASDEGLNAYGAVTWGQFFVYQGFNDRAGWMHTSSGVDAVDEFRETVVEATAADGSKGNVTKYGAEGRLTRTQSITLACLAYRPRVGAHGRFWHTSPRMGR